MDEWPPGDCEIVDAISFDVYGLPAPQGSKKGFVQGGRVRLIEVSKKVKPWRARVAAVAKKAAAKFDWERHVEGPVKVNIQFFVKFPQSPKWKRNGRPDKTPDIDKLARSTLDGISDARVIWGDDNQVVDLHAVEFYRDPPGARITITSMTERAKPKKRLKKSKITLAL
mgnify:CR=1 FL=1